MRVVFHYPGAKKKGEYLHDPKWWVFFGEKIELKTAVAYDREKVAGGKWRRLHSEQVCGVYVDDVKVAIGWTAESGWVVKGRWCATGKMIIDDLPYLLEGREWAGEYKSALCISCGKRVKHINNGDNAWTCGTLIDDVFAAYLYCNLPTCGKGVWECSECSTDNVGPVCPNCKKTRAECNKYR